MTTKFYSFSAAEIGEHWPGTGHLKVVNARNLDDILAECCSRLGQLLLELPELLELPGLAAAAVSQAGGICRDTRPALKLPRPLCRCAAVTAGKGLHVRQLEDPSTV